MNTEGSAQSNGAPPALSARFDIETIIHLLLIGLIGFGYRATFITQGFNATDEGWLQTVGRRITLGQVPYRDFDFVFPRMPVSIYKEAALQAILGDSYTLLVSRWVFVTEATLGSIIAYLILRRFVSERLAFLITLPTLFFSVLAYYFSNYTYDAEILVLVSALFLTISTPNRGWPAVVGGVAACLAGLAKPNYFAFVLFVPVLALVGGRMIKNRSQVHPALVGIYTKWPLFLAGATLAFGTVLALFAVAGAANALVHWPFPGAIETPSSQPLGFAIWQDLPTAFSSRELKLFGLIFILLALATVPALKKLRWIPVLGVPLGLIGYTYRYGGLGTGFLPMVVGLLLVINLAGLVLALAVRTPYLREGGHAIVLRSRLPAPELIVIALAFQYFAQFTTTGVLYSYLGAYLSLPVAVLLLLALFPVNPGNVRATRIASLGALAPTLFAVWVTANSIDYVQNHVYFDAPRSQLTATFKTPKLAGIWSTPANVRRVDGMVSMVDRYSKPGDPILVMPDFAALYYLTDRQNPTRQDWLGYFDPTPTEVAPVQDLESHPPKVVFVQTVSEFDWARSGRADYVIHYSNTRIAPIYEYLLDNYVQVATVDDIAVLIPRN